MKKGFILTGFILMLVGVVAIAFAATRSDFKKVFEGNVEVEELLFDTDNINMIKFDADADNLIIKKSNDSKIKIMNKKCEKYTYMVSEDVANNTLCISQKMNDGFIFDISTLFSFNTPKYEIYVPENIELNILMDAGNVDVANVSIKKLDIKINAGNLDIENVTANNSNINVEAGNIDIINSTFSNLISYVSAGNMDVEIKINNNANMEVNTGNLEIKLLGEKNDYNVNGNNPSGKVNIIYNVKVGNEDIKY